MDHYWNEIDDEIMDCLAGRAMTPAELGAKLGLTESSVCSLLAMLAIEGKVRIGLAERV